MGFISAWKRSFRKSVLIKQAAVDAQAFRHDKAIDDIHSFMISDQVFAKVLERFNATKSDIEAIMFGIMAAGAGGTYRGHFVPVSALLFPDTLTYLLRAERGEVGKAEAYSQVLEYFRTGAIVFESEKQFLK